MSCYYIPAQFPTRIIRDLLLCTQRVDKHEVIKDQKILNIHYELVLHFKPKPITHCLLPLLYYCTPKNINQSGSALRTETQQTIALFLQLEVELLRTCNNTGWSYRTLRYLQLGVELYVLVTTLGGATEPCAICSWGWSCYVLAATLGGATEPYAFLYPSHHNKL